MAIVADQLGLSWTELAREMNFSVDEINNIRVENPNSLAAQSFMLLKKWVGRDGTNATTDALTAVLTKVNRMDIVTLLEGPIFDYGNISGTRSFAEDNAVFLEQANGKGWNSGSSNSNMEPSTSKCSLSSETTNQHENRHTGSHKQNGKHTENSPVMQESTTEVTRHDERVGQGCEKATPESKFKVQQEDDSVLNKREGRPGDKKIYS